MAVSTAVVGILLAALLLAGLGPFVAASSSRLPATSVPPGALTAGFTFLPTQPDTGETITFTGSASGGSPPYTYNWNFGDLQTATGQIATHAYAVASTYTVTLTVNDTAGPGFTNNVTTATQSFVVKAALTASFGYTPGQPVSGQTITFTWTGTGGYSPYTFAWTFGDGGTSTANPATHAYASAGLETVTLTVTDSASHVASSSQTVTVLAPVTASFTYSPLTPSVGDTVTFTATASGGTSSYTYAWAFGDGSSGTGQTTTHAYASAGSFTVTLTVTDSASHVATSSKTVAVSGALAAAFTFTPASPAAGDTVAFTGTTSGGTAPYAYAWNFGDGATATVQNPSHVFTAPGTYTVTLTVRDSASHTATASHSVVVTAVLSVTFTFSPLSPAVGDTVTFTATPTGGTGPYSYAWNFGDGGVGSGATPTHAYATAGSYTVSLTVSDAVGHTASASGPIVVSSTLSADLTYTPTQPVVGETVSFTATAHGGTSPYTFAWTFGDGSTGTGATVTHAYAAARTYTVNVAISDSAVHSTSVTASVVVTLPLASAFTFSPASPATGDTVSFNGSALGGTGPYTFAWAFGDGGTATGANVTHAFASAGTFSVTLTASDSAGHTAVTSKSVSITGGLGTSFTFSPAQPVIGDLVAFTASATGGTPPYKYNWTFGDGAAATGATPTHAYATAGTFTVTLSVADSAGHSATVTRSVLVVPPLTGSFTYSPNLPLTFEQITFNATAAGGTPPYVFAWSFGDGSTASGPSVSHPYASPGTYNVTVRIIDAQGRILSVSQDVQVFYLLAAGFTISQVFPQIGEVVLFSAQARGASPPYSFSWDFGDGATAQGANVSHAYTTAGAVTVTLTATDAQDHTATASKPVVVTPGLVADIHISQAAPLVGEAVNFTALPGGGAPPYKYNWTFGDGTNGSGAVVNHSYRAPGSYLVVLTVTDSAGHNASAFRLITAVAVFFANITFEPVRPVVGESVTFSANATGGTFPYSYAWRLGDGSTSAEAVVHHAYGAPDNYTVTLTLTDAGGHVLVITQTVPVGIPLHVDFAFSPSRPTTGATISFVGNASGGQPPYTYTWYFGDGVSAHSLTTDHTYSDFGLSATHTVVFTVCDAAGRCVSASESIEFQNLFLISFLVEIGLAAPVIAWWILTRRPRPLREE